jgi:hypothetical protein
LSIARPLFFAAALLPWLLISFPAAQESTLDGIAGTAPSPFSSGERLLYDVEWDPPWYLFFLPAMEAGEIDLQFEGEVPHNDGKAFKIAFKANSSGLLSKLAGITIEDIYDFLVEPETFCSLEVHQKIREGKRKKQIDVEYFRDKNQLHIREMDESVVPPKLKKDAMKDNIPSCVHDPLSAVYLLRRSPLQVDQVRVFVIGYDDRIKEVESRVEKQEKVKTPAGEFAAWQIRTTALMGGLFKEGGQFRIWISADEKRLPLQFEVKVKLGKVMGKLKQHSPPTDADIR